MKRREIDALWFDAMERSVRKGDEFTRYEFAALVAAAERDRLMDDIKALWYGCDPGDMHPDYAEVWRKYSDPETGGFSAAIRARATCQRESRPPDGGIGNMTFTEYCDAVEAGVTEIHRGKPWFTVVYTESVKGSYESFLPLQEAIQLAAFDTFCFSYYVSR